MSSTNACTAVLQINQRLHKTLAFNVCHLIPDSSWKSRPSHPSLSVYQAEAFAAADTTIRPPTEFEPPEQTPNEEPRKGDPPLRPIRPEEEPKVWTYPSLLSSCNEVYVPDRRELEQTILHAA